MKTCRLCGKEQPLTEFHKQKSNVDGHKTECKSCRRLESIARKDAKTVYDQERYKAAPEVRKAQVAAYRERHPDRVRLTQYKRRFGVTAELLATLTLAKGGECAICGVLLAASPNGTNT